MRGLVLFFSFLLSFLISNDVQAQFISFTDPNFKNALVNTNCVDLDGNGSGDADADRNNDGEISYEEVSGIVGLNISNQTISDVSEIINFEKLEYLNCSNNKISSFEIYKLKKMKRLFCGFNSITKLNVSDLTNLERLVCDHNKISTLKLSNLPDLVYVSCSFNILEDLNLEALPVLEGLNCNHNLLKFLDVSKTSSLYQLECESNQLEYLILRNGNTDWPFLFFDNNDDLTYICCDENIIERIKTMTLNLGLLYCEVNSYCSFTPSGTFYTINGHNGYDDNKNGCDNFDKNLLHLKYKIINGNVEGTFLSNATGNYSIPVQGGTHTITPILANTGFFEVSPPSITITFPSTSDTITQNFCITAKEPYRQVDITVIGLSPPARPGFDAKYKIIWENKGNLLENGTIHFTYDENIFDYVKATLSPGVINSGRLSWDYADLLPFEKREITVTLNLNSPTENPTVNPGDITYLYANILDNIFTLENTIVGSYDPNDKTCLQGNYLHPDSVGKYVDFLIRFENTGNYAAENIVVKDIIDDKVFDVSSLQITDASHEMYTRIAGNKVEFIFEDIQLPFDDENNDGYVAFKIKTKSTLKLGDKLKNLADIYFDYNFPIRTNETQTTIAIPSGTKYVETEVTIHPNPVRDVLTLDSSNRWTKAEIFDISGRIVKVTAVDDFSVDVSGLDSGTYILHLSDKDKRGRVKFVKL